MHLRGVSVAGICTSLQIPEVRLCVDLGLITPTNIRMSTVALTHGHIDHAGALANYLGQRSLMHLGPSRVIAPKDLVPDLQAMVSIWERIQGRTYAIDWIAAYPDQKIDLGKGRFLIPYEAQHTVPALGYTLGTCRRKLKPEYEGLRQDEIVALKRTGRPITDDVDTPEITFTGDGMIDGLLASDFARKASVLVSELTFLGDPSTSASPPQSDRSQRSFAHEGKHTHILDLVDALPSLQCDQLVLMHFSSKHTLKEINKVVSNALPDDWWTRTTILHHQNRNQRGA